MIKQAWAIEHDTDTDTELIAWPREENDRRERKRKVCGDDDPAVADQVDDDPAVADQVDDLQALPSSQRKIIMKPRPKVKLTPAEGAATKLYVKRHPLQVFNLTHAGTTFGTTSDVRRVQYDKDNIPCRTYLRDIQIATYTIGRLCDPNDLARALRATGFEVVVITFTADLWKLDPVYQAIKRWAKVSRDFDGTHPPANSLAADIDDVLQDKRIAELGTQGVMFAVLHRNKVRCAMFEERALSSCGDEDSAAPVHFGTLTVHLQKACTDNEFVRIGVIHVRHRLTDAQIDGLSQWIILHRLPVLTGFIGFSHDCRTHNERFERYAHDSALSSHEEAHGSPLTELALRSGAIGRESLFQRVDMSMDPDSECTWTVPSVFLFFGYYTKIKVPRYAPKLRDSPRCLELGTDITNEFISDIQLPVWAHNDDGNAYVPHLSTIRMTQVDWSRWFDGCFQTWVRFGKPSTKGELKARKVERCQIKKLRKRRRRVPRNDGQESEDS